MVEAAARHTSSDVLGHVLVTECDLDHVQHVPHLPSHLVDSWYPVEPRDVNGGRCSSLQ